MHRLGGLALLALAASFGIPTVRAAEIRGRVAAVTGQEITVDIDEDVLSAVGDSVRVVVAVPNVGEAKVGTGRVTGIRGKQVVASIDKATGQLAVGQAVRIVASGGQPAPEAAATVKTPQPTRAPPRPRGAVPTSNPVERPSLVAPAEPVEISSALVGQTDHSREVVKAVAEVLPRLHLSRHPVDDEIGRRTIRVFIDRLDPDKLFFNQADVDGFLAQGSAMSDGLRRGDLPQAYEIFRRFLRRLGERVALAQQLLDTQHDFTIDEELLLRDPSSQWPTDQPTALETWRKWIKYHMLTHRAVGADWAEARSRTARTIRDLVQRMQRVSDNDLQNSLLDALAGAYDPHSSYMSQKSFDEFNAALKQQMVGVGAVLAEADGYVTVQNLIPGGPADRQGRMKPGDRIVGVGEGPDGSIEDVVGRPLAEVVGMIRGPEGTVVRLRVIPQGEFEAQVYSAKRDRVDLTTLGTAVLTGDQVRASETAKIGYVYLPTFYTDLAAQRAGREDYRSSARDLRPKLEEFRKRGVHVVVLDARNNNGGGLQESIDTTSLFIGGAPVMQQRNREGEIAQLANERATLAWGGPLVVLTDRVTAGGAEILAAAIHDYRRGLVVGDSSTFGVGTIADLFDVARVLDRPAPAGSLGYLRVTAAKFYRVNGQSTQRRGVVPDIVLPSPAADAPPGEALKPFSLMGDAIDPLQFSDFGYDTPPELLQTLRQRSEQRRREDAYFRRLAAQLTQARRSHTGTVIPLSERAFLAPRTPRGQDSNRTTNKVPGIPAAVLDEYLVEVLAIALDYAARAHVSAAERMYLRGDYKAALVGYQDSIDTAPTFADGHYRLAWTLSTCPEAKFRDGERAIRHARIACELSQWKVWSYLLGLSIAEAETGRFSDAQAHLTQALDLAPEDQRQAYQYLRDRFSASRPYAPPP